MLTRLMRRLAAGSNERILNIVEDELTETIESYEDIMASMDKDGRDVSLAGMTKDQLQGGLNQAEYTLLMVRKLRKP
jgi:rRNA pseudouridine-1189 N-methylase Emg1 (Nep1/Mra1 family)